MEPLFVAEWKYDKKTIYELIPLFRKNSVLSSTATFAVPLFIVLFFCFPHENGLFDGSGIFLLSVAAFFALCHIFEPRLRIRMFFKSYKNCFSEQGNLQAAFFDDELKLQISDGKVESIGAAEEIMPKLFNQEADSCECRRQKGGELYGA